MKKHIFRKPFFLYFLVLMLSMIFVEVYVTGVVRTHYIDEWKKNLLVQTELLAESISLKEGVNLDAFSRYFADKIGARVTVISAAGKVLGDSHSKSISMDSHAGRPEIQQAHIAGSGSSIRFSNTTSENYLYVAKKIAATNKAMGFIRLAMPISQLNTSVNILRLEINLVVIILFCMSGAVLAWQTEKIRKNVHLIAEYAGRLSNGLFRKRLYMEGTGEFSELAGSLNEMANELETTIVQKNEETNRLNVILKSIPDALLLINISDQIELSNNTARELFCSSNLEGRSYIEIVRSPEFSALLDRVKKDRTPSSVELVLDFPNEIYLTVSVSPLSYKVGELSGFVAIFHDTTMMKNLEQMRKDFVANVSHEIKTPLTAIQGFTETLLEGAIDDRENGTRFLKTILLHSERLNRLVEDLL
nr:PAS domain S-box protein [bacterium]